MGDGDWHLPELLPRLWRVCPTAMSLARMRPSSPSQLVMTGVLLLQGPDDPSSAQPTIRSSRLKLTRTGGHAKCRHRSQVAAWAQQGTAGPHAHAPHAVEWLQRAMGGLAWACMASIFTNLASASCLAAVGLRASCQLVLRVRSGGDESSTCTRYHSGLTIGHAMEH